MLPQHAMINFKPPTLAALALLLVLVVHLVVFYSFKPFYYNQGAKLYKAIFAADLAATGGVAESSGTALASQSEQATTASGEGTAKQIRYISIQMAFGRLGNNMFQYASMYGIAKRYNFYPVLRDNAPLLKFIDARHIRAHVVPAEQWYRASWRSWRESRASSYNRTELESGLAAQGNVMLEFYLQSYRYFEGYEAEVVSQFVFSQAVRDWASAVLQKVTARMPRGKPNSTIVGIHIRRGDYLQDAAKKVGYNTPGEEYYIKAVRYFTSRYAFVAFIVSSNDIHWATEFLFHLSFYNPKIKKSAIFEVTSGNEDQPEKDMAILCLTNHSVLSAGSYSFWSAMLRQYRTGQSDGGTTVYYTKPFMPNSEIAKTYGNSVENFYPPDWIGID